jgi:hypothetical protein
VDSWGADWDGSGGVRASVPGVHASDPGGGKEMSALYGDHRREGASVNFSHRQSTLRLASWRFVRTVCLLGVAGLPAVSLFVATQRAGAGGPVQRCVKPTRAAVGTGTVPGGARWSVRASIGNEEQCHAWMLGIQFRPYGQDAGSWRGSWRVPVGGHLANGFTIDAFDEPFATKGVVSGVVGGHVTTILLVMTSGKRYAITPKLPSRSVRHKHRWLRQLRYFMFFYRPGQRVVGAKLLGPKGEVIFRTSDHVEGEIKGPLQ